MKLPYPDPDSEPVFAMLATDPEFSQTANELLQPRSYAARHNDSNIVANNHPNNCPACAPHKIAYLASPAGRQNHPKVVREGVVVPHRTPLKGSRTKNTNGNGKRRKS